MCQVLKSTLLDLGPTILSYLHDVKVQSTQEAHCQGWAFAGGAGGGRREGVSLVFLARGMARHPTGRTRRRSAFFSPGVRGGLGLGWGF